MSNYFQNLLDSSKIFHMVDKRTIITDRMGPWSNQCLTLAWEDATGECSVSPDEAEILFNYGRLSNVQRIYDGTISMGMIYADIREFNAVIVCGIITPSNNIRKEILDYAKSRGYIAFSPTPVEMLNGTKYLERNNDGSYKITYLWSSKIKADCVPHHLNQFTEKYFRNEFKRKRTHFSNGTTTTSAFYSAPKITITADGFIIDNLLESEVFTRENIDAIREYDIQIRCLSTKIDKNVLLKALIQFGYMYSLPENLRLSYNASLRDPTPYLSLPLYQYTPKLSKDNLFVPLKSGDLIYFSSDILGINRYSVSYKLKVPYSECVRELMKNLETLMKKTYDSEKCDIKFNPFRQTIRIEMPFVEDPKYSLCGQIEKELVTLDYAISLLEECKKSNYDQLVYAILRFYASDTNFPSEELFNFYFTHLNSNLQKE